MKAMQRQDNPNRKKYSNDPENPNRPLPDVRTIKRCFGSRKQNGPAKPREDTVADIKARCHALELPVTKKKVLQKILELKNDPMAHKKSNTRELEDRCKELQLIEDGKTTEKVLMLCMLSLHNNPETDPHGRKTRRYLDRM
ncbi:predicted protein [Chaetoceros tenuissimus]|uniref:Uncharacterized protein n=1 Tax=Chaetoceros tenuissimus TaxID=426638 RepID=A0AAD3CQR1_9STRA|nr:predicted protein [Chaetoceros tenuissimus]